MSEKMTLCLVEDDAIMGESLSERFQLEGFTVQWYRSATAALERIATDSYAAVISDIRLPDLTGEQMYQKLLAQGQPLPAFIFITGYGSIDQAVRLLKLGAADYVTKPFDLDELVAKIQALSPTPSAPVREGRPVLGISPAMRRIEQMLPRLCAQAETILITGESGVGKEIVARELHRLDPRTAGKPFVAVNCAALPETLLEAELFGHEKGAFTGAHRAKKGVFEQADGGTLFLDEIGDMSPAMQAKLLRAIQDRQIVRLGGDRPIAVSLRLICATHNDLKQMVKDGGFREDLFYRIHVIHLRVPPLRERKEDILWFAQMFLQEFAAQHGSAPRALLPATEQVMLAYPWPGNIRELKHCIERACILSPEPVLEPCALFEGMPEFVVRGDADADLGRFLAECERSYITQALERHGWHISHTATFLGISRKNLWEKMKKLGIHGVSVHDSEQPGRS
jgi:DNA-binding NtrC family response regulator